MNLLLLAKQFFHPKTKVVLGLALVLVALLDRKLVGDVDAVNDMVWLGVCVEIFRE